MNKTLTGILLALLLITFGFIGLGAVAYFRDDSSDIQSAADCTSVELYDPQTNECYYECDTDEECAAIEARIDQELNQLFENTTTRVSNHSENSQTSDGVAENSQGTYRYVNGVFEPEILDTQEAKYASIFVSIASKDFANSYLSQITFFNDSNNDTAASVSQNQDDMAKWDLEINMAYASDESEMLMTLVHEYAHIFSLNAKQVDGTVQGSCPALELAEGCAKANSYINSFQSAFWSSKNASPENEEFGAFYSGNESDFVSEYAATNVIEDFAETFSYATLKDTSSYTAGASKKIAWMKDQPEVAQRMQEIKRALAGNLRARKIIQ